MHVAPRIVVHCCPIVKLPVTRTWSCAIPEWRILSIMDTHTPIHDMQQWILPLDRYRSQIQIDLLTIRGGWVGGRNAHDTRGTVVNPATLDVKSVVGPNYSEWTVVVRRKSLEIGKICRDAHRFQPGWQWKGDGNGMDMHDGNVWRCDRLVWHVWHGWLWQCGHARIPGRDWRLLPLRSNRLRKTSQKYFAFWTWSSQSLSLIDQISFQGWSQKRQSRKFPVKNWPQTVLLGRKTSFRRKSSDFRPLGKHLYNNNVTSIWALPK